MNTTIYTVTTEVNETKQGAIVNSTSEQSIFSDKAAALNFGRIKATQRARIYHETRRAFDEGEIDSYFSYCVWVERHEAREDGKFCFEEIVARDIIHGGYLV